MPIKPKYEWTQSEREVVISVFIPGASPDTTSVECGDVALKVNSPPSYLLVVDLLEPVDANAASVEFYGGTVRITVEKRNVIVWPDLLAKGLSPAELRERRTASLEKARQAQLAEATARRTRKRAEKDLAFREQMEVERKERDHLDEEKRIEKSRAEAEVFETLGSRGAATRGEAASREAPSSKAGRDIFESNETAHAPGGSQSVSVAEQQDATVDDVVYIPAPRGTSAAGKAAATTRKVAIGFSRRVFPTPQRASRARQEADWLARNQHLIDARRRAEAARRGEITDGGTKFDNGSASASGSTDISHRDPAWLKDKGDDLLRGGDARSAVNAYTAALDIDPALRAALGNRAAACLRLGLAEAAARDCTTAMMLLPAPREPPAPPLPPVSLPALSLPSPAGGEQESKGLGKSSGSGSGSASTPAPTPELLWEREALDRAQRAADCLEALLDGADEDAGERGSGLGGSGAAGGLRRPGVLGADSVESEKLGLVKLLARRGTAHCKCGDFLRAQADFHAASDVAGRCEAEEVRAKGPILEEDARRMGVLADCSLQKGEGDAALRRGAVAEAEQAYAKALELEPAFVPALVNRSVLRSRQGAWEECRADCTGALRALGVSSDDRPLAVQLEASGKDGTRADFVPTPGSTRLRAWLLGALLRRAQALVKLGELAESLSDFRRALELDPLNPKVQADMQRVYGAMVVEEEVSEEMLQRMKQQYAGEQPGAAGEAGGKGTGKGLSGAAAGVATAS